MPISLQERNNYQDQGFLVLEGFADEFSAILSRQIDERG